MEILGSPAHHVRSLKLSAFQNPDRCGRHFTTNRTHFLARTKSSHSHGSHGVNKKTTISMDSLDLSGASRKTDSRFPAWASSQSWRCAPLPAQGKSVAAERNQFRRAKQWQCTKTKTATWFLSFFQSSHHFLHGFC
jgi:hypothetical protein